MEKLETLPLECGIAGLAHPGHEASGDEYVHQPFHGGALIGVIDGVGHGAEAATAAKLACSILTLNAEQNVLSLIRLCHEGLRGTRGAAMSLASFNFQDRLMTWVGVGNVQGILLRLDTAVSIQEECLLLRPGVVGSNLSPLQASVLPIGPGDTLVFATDGVQSNFDRSLARNQPPRRAVETLLIQHAKGSDDALIFIARYVGGRA